MFDQDGDAFCSTCLVVAITFRTEATARRFEKYLKSGSGRAFAKRHFDSIASEN